MDTFKFNHPDVDSQFETAFTHNPKVRVPNHFNGRLADIHPAAAKALITQGSNMLIRKAGKVTLAEVAAREKNKAQSAS